MSFSSLSLSCQCYYKTSKITAGKWDLGANVMTAHLTTEKRNLGALKRGMMAQRFHLICNKDAINDENPNMA